MSIVADQIGDVERYDESYYGSSAGWHEQPNDVAFPGDVKLDDDPEESDMNTLASLKAERIRLRELVPGSMVLVVKVMKSFGNDDCTSDRVQWEVSIARHGVMGICYAECATTTLRDACDAALADYRAGKMDAKGTEGSVAA